MPNPAKPALKIAGAFRGVTSRDPLSAAIRDPGIIPLPGIEVQFFRRSGIGISEVLLARIDGLQGAWKGSRWQTDTLLVRVLPSLESRIVQAAEIFRIGYRDKYLSEDTAAFLADLAKPL